MYISIELGSGKVNLRVTVLCSTSKGILVEKSKDDFYFPIGGRIKFQEDSLFAARREFQEEIGLKSPDLEYIGVIDNFFHHQKIQFHEINFVYRTYISEIPVLPPEIEIIDLKEYPGIDIRPKKITDIVNGTVSIPFQLTIGD